MTLLDFQFTILSKCLSSITEDLQFSFNYIRLKVYIAVQEEAVSTDLQIHELPLPAERSMVWQWETSQQTENKLFSGLMFIKMFCLPNEHIGQQCSGDYLL